MKKLTEKEMTLVKSLRCPTCKKTAKMHNIEWSSSLTAEIPQDFDLKDDSQVSHWRIKPVLVWCGKCKKVLLDRREDFADAIRNFTITLDDGTVLPKPKDFDPWKEDPDYPVEDWQHEVGMNDTRLGYRDWVVHKKEAYIESGYED